ncbi:GNAT family N-acetyltransferase [Rhodococcus sp. IEGM 1379]|uniref:GNAT family N-acetyltransferase n=1 Tax=Rhodococcus sp. IEGM 1379 TaxID=3047086 RepID=UPI0024B87536|nr:GNAT family N-acetyltransferase [Rhodococcus sp. IEGM 1379]MDI9918282.1 GNAT family N-acetyltransferase [Rhodococcus sp. IEGM 1379]
MNIVIEQLQQVTPDDIEDLRRLFPQLSSSASELDPAASTEIVTSPTTTVLIARAQQKIVGTLTLVVVKIPTGVRARIEDVVVDENHRGSGIGAALTREALTRSQQQGARTVDLSSHSTRQAAHRLYLSLGFHIRDSSMYRFQFDDNPLLATAAIPPIQN